MITMLFIIENAIIFAYGVYKLARYYREKKRAELAKQFDDLCAARSNGNNEFTCQTCPLRHSTVCNKPLGKVTNEELRAGIEILEFCKEDEPDEDH